MVKIYVPTLASMKQDPPMYTRVISGSTSLLACHVGQSSLYVMTLMFCLRSRLIRTSVVPSTGQEHLYVRAIEAK